MNLTIPGLVEGFRYLSLQIRIIHTKLYIPPAGKVWGVKNIVTFLWQTYSKGRYDIQLYQIREPAEHSWMFVSARGFLRHARKLLGNVFGDICDMLGRFPDKFNKLIGHVIQHT